MNFLEVIKKLTPELIFWGKNIYSIKELSTVFIAFNIWLITTILMGYKAKVCSSLSSQNMMHYNRNYKNHIRLFKWYFTWCHLHEYQTRRLFPLLSKGWASQYCSSQVIDKCLFNHKIDEIQELINWPS